MKRKILNLAVGIIVLINLQLWDLFTKNRSNHQATIK